MHRGKPRQFPASQKRGGRLMRGPVRAAAHFADILVCRACAFLKRGFGGQKLRRVFAEAVPDGFPDAKDAEKVARRTVVVREG